MRAGRIHRALARDPADLVGEVVGEVVCVLNSDLGELGLLILFAFDFPGTEGLFAIV